MPNPSLRKDLIMTKLTTFWSVKYTPSVCKRSKIAQNVYPIAAPYRKSYYSHEIFPENTCKVKRRGQISLKNAHLWEFQMASKKWCSTPRGLVGF